MIIFPRSLPPQAKMTRVTFDLRPMRTMTPLAWGDIIDVNIGPDLWRLDAALKPMRPRDLAAVEAWLDTVAGERFTAYHPTRQRPLAYTAETFSALVFTVGAGQVSLGDVEDNNLEMTLEDAPVGLVLSAGDLLSFDYGPYRALHRVALGGTAGVGGTLDVEVRPPVRPGWEPDTPVDLIRPHCNMKFPEKPSPSQDGYLGEVTLQGVQVP